MVKKVSRKIRRTRQENNPVIDWGRLTRPISPQKRGFFCSRKKELDERKTVVKITNPNFLDAYRLVRILDQGIRDLFDVELRPLLQNEGHACGRRELELTSLDLGLTSAAVGLGEEEVEDLAGEEVVFQGPILLSHDLGEPSEGEVTVEVTDLTFAQAQVTRGGDVPLGQRVQGLDQLLLVLHLLLYQLAADGTAD